MFSKLRHQLPKAFTAVALLLLFSFLTTHASSQPNSFWSSRAAQTTFSPDVVTVSASKTDSLLNDLNGNALVDPGDTIEYSIFLENSGDEDALDTLFSDITNDSQLAIVPGSLRATPITVDDSYQLFGNTAVTISTLDGLLHNDIDPDGGTLTASCAVCTTTQGGQVTLAASGSFSYNPPTGFSGTDTFTYTITDPHGLTSTGTVTFHISERIWWVDSDAPSGGDGSYLSPFNSLAPLNNSTGPDQDNDIIFIYQRGSSYASQLVLKEGQHLCGQGSSLQSCATITPPLGTTFPAVTSSPTLEIFNNGRAITLAPNNTLHGLSISGVGSEAIFGTDVDTVTINNVDINVAATAVHLENGTLTGSFNSITSTDGSYHIYLLNIDGSANLGSGDLSNSSDTAVFIDGGSASLTYSGSISSNVGDAIHIRNKSGGTVQFSGPVSGASSQISISQNSNTAVHFTGALTLVTNGRSAFTAVDNSGDITASNANNSLQSNNATALNVVNSSIGTAGLNFLSISANNASHGILLDNTGTNGSLTVTGNGNADGSGGLISNISQRGISLIDTAQISLANMQLNNANTVDGTPSTGQLDGSQNLNENGAIHLQSVVDVSLTNIDINGSAQHGINGNQVTHLTIQDSSIQHTGDSAWESGIYLFNLLGTVSDNQANLFNNLSIYSSGHHNIFVQNSLGSHAPSGETDSLTIQSSNLSGATNDLSGDQLVVLQRQTANLSLQLSTVNLSGGVGTTLNNLRFASYDNSHGRLQFTNSSTNNGNTAVHFSAHNNATATFNIHNNTLLRNLEGNTVDINGHDNATLHGTLYNNGLNSLSANAAGANIDIVGEDNSTIIVNVQNNTLSNQMTGIRAGARGTGSANIQATIRYNLVSTGGNYPFSALYLFSGNGSAGENNTACFNVASNSFSTISEYDTDYLLEQHAGNTFQLQGLSPATGATELQVETFIVNTDITPGKTAEAYGGSVVNYTAATCTPVPTLAPDDQTSSPTAVQTNNPPPSTPKQGTVSAPPTKQTKLHNPPTAVAHIQQATQTSTTPNNIAATSTVGPFTLPAGKSTTISFQAVVNAPFPEGQNPVCNQATISGSNFSDVLSDDPDVVGSNDPTCTPINLATDLQLSKSDGGATAVPGGNIAYLLIYNNSGIYGAPNAVITETVPAHTTFNPTISTPGWNCTGTVCTYSLGNLSIGAWGDVTFGVTVDNPVDAGISQIDNSATIGSDADDLDPANNVANDTTPLNAQPDLSIVKSDNNAQVLPGDSITYTLTYQNSGNQGATAVLVQDTVPANTSFNPSASSSGWVCIPNNNAGSICNQAISSLSAGDNGSFTFVVDVDDPLPSGTQAITNTATISDDGSNGIDPTPANNSSTDITPIANQAPWLTDLTISSPIDEGTTAVLSGTIHDPDPLDSFDLLVDWGDGNISSFSYWAGTSSFSESHTYLDDNPSGTASDVYTVTLILTDNANNSHHTTTAVTVHNVAPQLADLTATAVDENQLTTLTGSIIDPSPLDSFSLLVDWGDGITNTFNYQAGTTSFNETHQYLDDDPSGTASDVYTIAVTLTDDDTGSDHDTTAVTVNNVAPTLSNLSVTPIIINESETITLTANIIDPGTLDSFSLLIDWGDGITDTVNYPAGTTNFSQTHTYANDVLAALQNSQLLGSFTIAVTLTDDDTGSDSQNIIVIVNNVAPALSNLSLTPTLNEGDTAVLSGDIIDPGLEDSFSLLVDWGDGITNTFNYPAGTTSFNESHPYLDDDPSGTASDVYTVTLTLSDSNGGSQVALLSTTVHNVAPQLADLTTTAVDENELTTLTGSLIDPGPLDSFSLLVDWGDGSSDTFNYQAGTTNFNETHQYLDDDPSGTTSDVYTVTLTLTDDDSGSDTDSVTVTVHNVPPQLADLTTTAVDENAFTTLTGSLIDPGTLDSFSLLIDWGDGITDTFSYPAGTAVFSQTHQYLDDGIYTVNLTVTDDDLGSSSDSVTVTVHNVPPQLADLATTAVNENEFTTLSGSIIDPGTLDSFSLLVDWGDGITNTFNYQAGTTSFNETHQYLDDDPSGTASDVYTVTLTVTDDDGGSSNGTTAVTVHNVAPDLLNLAATPLNLPENSTITVTAQISDVGSLDSFTVWVDWADGITETFSYPAGSNQFIANHTYVDDALRPLLADFTIAVTLTDDDTGSDTDSVTVQVDNVPPMLSNVQLTPSINEGDTAVLSGDIFDASPADSFTLVVTWGDGQNNIYNYPAGSTSFSESHIYLDDDPSGTPSDVYTATLTLMDDNGGTAVQQTAVTVHNVAPQLADLFLTPSVAENDTAVLSGSIVDPGTLDSFSLLVDWGDGITDTFNYSAGTAVFSQTHQYLDDDPPGTASDIYTVTLTLTDDDSGSSSQTQTVLVENVAPIVDAGPDQTALVGETLSFSGSFSDVGSLDSHTILWEFGDGHTITNTLTPSHTYSAAGVYVVTLTVTDDDLGSSSDQLVVTIGGGKLYLPIMRAAGGPLPAPDLIISELSASGNQVSLTITNQGDAPVTAPFWVDLYLDPDPIPTAVNQTWPFVAQQGMVWGVEGISLNPGQSVTLSLGDSYYRADLSQFSGTFASGTAVYAQVDSAHSDTSYGNILEGHEQNGGPYNNISSTVVP